MDTDLLDLARTIEMFVYKRAVKKSHALKDLAESVSMALESVGSMLDETSGLWYNAKAEKVRELFSHY